MTHFDQEGRPLGVSEREQEMNPNSRPDGPGSGDPRGRLETPALSDPAAGQEPGEGLERAGLLKEAQRDPAGGDVRKEKQADPAGGDVRKEKQADPAGRDRRKEKMGGEKGGGRRRDASSRSRRQTRPGDPRQAPSPGPGPGQQPGARSQQPGGIGQQPGATGQQPGATGPQPGAIGQKPGARGQAGGQNVPPGYPPYPPWYGPAAPASYVYGPGRRKGWKKGLLILGLILLIIVLLVTGLAVFMSTSGQNGFNSPDREYLARISVVGEIGNYNDSYSSSEQTYHHLWTMDTINKLAEDTWNRGIVLYVNSPGGSVYESDELYLKLEAYKQRTGRPIYVYMGSMAASGGYYISAPAKAIYANRNTWTGSIGVIIGTLFDVSDFLKENGVKATDITSGANKGMGGYFEPMSTEQRAIFQSLVDDAYDQFVDIVAKGRGMTVAEVRAIADGRIYTANQAKKNGLIDEIATQEEAMEKIKTDLGDPNLYVEDMIYHAESSNLTIPLLGYTSLTDAVRQLLGMDKGGGISPMTPGLETGKGADAQAFSGLSGDVAAVLELTRQGDRIPIKYLYQ